MKFLDKIDTEAALIEAIRAHGELDPVYALMEAGSVAVDRRFATTRDNVSFWWNREYLRLKLNFYEVTAVLNELNARFPICAHISLTDRNMVAYTPDRASGMADRQVTTTPGRLFSKYMPVVTDAYIQDMVARHLAEANMAIEFITGPAIAETYSNGMSGVGACMSSKAFLGVQPTMAYDAENIKLAVLRDHTGKITARCMVYEASETDKRWIRLYGDKQRLQILLEKQGYKCGTWAGAKFKAAHIKDQWKNEDGGLMAHIAFPYLDCKNGFSDATYNTVILLNDKVWALTPEQNKRATALSLHTGVGHSGGELTLRAYTDEDLCRVDDLTQEKVALFGDNSVEGAEIYKDGLVLWTQKKNVPEGWVTARLITNDHSRNTVYADPAACFRHGSTLVVEHEAARRYLGYYRLASKLYPDGGWVNGRTITKDGDVIKQEDAVYLIDDVNGSGIIHKSELPGKSVLLTKDPDKGYAGYVTHGSKVHKTPSGKKVHPQYNGNIVSLWDDTVDFVRNCKFKYRSVLTVSYSARDAEHSTAFLQSDKFKELLRKRWGLLDEPRNVYSMLRHITEYWHPGNNLAPELAADMARIMGERNLFFLVRQLEKLNPTDLVKFVVNSSTLDTLPYKNVIVDLMNEWRTFAEERFAEIKAETEAKLGHPEYAIDFFKVGDEVRIARVDIEDLRTTKSLKGYEHFIGDTSTVRAINVETDGSVHIRLTDYGGYCFPINTLEPVTPLPEPVVAEILAEAPPQAENAQFALPA